MYNSIIFELFKYIEIFLVVLLLFIVLLVVIVKKTFAKRFIIRNCYKIQFHPSLFLYSKAHKLTKEKHISVVNVVNVAIIKEDVQIFNKVNELTAIIN